ncbi:MAG: DNA polymerase IV [Nanobdellota archaeon]
MEKIIAHLDMDCFFCQCEIKKKPELGKKPVIVGNTGARGVVSAANYEARKFGVYSAIPISRARMLCPEGIFLPVDKSLYSKESSKIMDNLALVVEDIEQVSIDEAYLDITMLTLEKGSMENAAQYLQSLVKNASGMSCSVGVSNSRIVSKIASDFKKPGGITIVRDTKKFLADLDIGKIPGIGKVTKQRFIAKNVKTIGELADMDKFKLMDDFGRHGVVLQNVARGLDRTYLSKRYKAKSYSREDTFSEDVSCYSVLLDNFMEISKRVVKDLSNYYFRTVSIKIRYSNFKTITRDFSFKTPQSSIKAVEKASRELFDRNYERGRGVRLIGVKLSNISGGTEKQLTLSTFFDSNK